MTTTREATSALIVDVDGTLSPVHPDRDVWGDEVTAGHLFGPVRVSPTLCRRLDQLGAQPDVEPLWLTSWAPESRWAMDPFPGRTWTTLQPPPYAGDEPSRREREEPARANLVRLDWWKWRALRGWLGHHSSIRTLVWCDDQLAQALWLHEDAEEDVALADAGPAVRPLELEPEVAPFVTTASALIEVRLAEAGVAATLVAPAPSVGLTPADLARVEEALAADGPP